LPNPGYDPADLAEAVRLVQLHGTVTEASNASGIPRSTLDKRYKKASADPAMEAAQEAVGTNLVPTEWWAKTKPNEDGVAYSVRMKPAQEAAIPLEERLAEALANIPRPGPVQPPEKHDADLLTIYPIADAHIGMMAWGKETGEPYDTNIAAERIREWIARAVDASPASGEAVILDVGDLTHADDDTNMTPRSKHVLSVDTRHFRTLDVTIAALAGAVDYACASTRR
jgi:hypothetical protein